MTRQTVGFIGAGNMAQAIIHGMVNSGLYSGNHILVNNRSDKEKIINLEKKYFIKCCNKFDLVKESSIIILAVKPQDLTGVLSEISQWVTKEHIVISLAAGIGTGYIEDMLGHKRAVIRVMPNTSAKVMLSATAMAKGRWVNNIQFDIAREIFACVGTVREVSERHMDAITGLSGSGPAYVYTFIEAMIDGGRNLGLSKEESTEFAVQTLKGAVEMVINTGYSPSELSSQICSPNGTTVAGLNVLNNLRFKDIVIEAINAAAKRSSELRSV